MIPRLTKLTTQLNLKYHVILLKRLIKGADNGLGTVPGESKNYRNLILNLMDDNQYEVFDISPEYKNRSFSFEMNKLLIDKGLNRRDIVAKAEINENSFDKYISGERKPKRNQVLKICLGMNTSIKETDYLLELSGHNRLGTGNDERDVIVSYCLKHKLSFYKCSELIEQYENKNHEIIR